MCRPISSMRRFSCPTCGAKRGKRCIGGRIHKARRNKARDNKN